MGVKKRLVCVLFILIFGVTGANAEYHIKASKIFFGGQVFTSDAGDLWKEAIAIKGKRILRVGTDKQILALAGPRTEIYDLEGRLLIPGLNNAFVHIQPSNVNGPIINDPSYIPGPGPNVSEMLIFLEYAVENIPPGTWLWGLIGDAVLDDPEMSRFILDTVSPDHPVIMASWSGTKLYFNTYAMEEMGILENEPEPFGGSYDRVEGTDIINGGVSAYALGRVIIATRDMTPIDVLRSQYEQVVQRLLTLGVTTVQDHAILPLSFQEDITRELETPIRIHNITHPFTIGESRSECRPGPGFRNPLGRVWSGGIAWLTDGTPIERGSATIEPYADKPDWYGVFNFSLDDFQEIVDDGLRWPRRYNQRSFYAVGDRSIENIINAMEATAPDWAWRKHRIRVIHPEMITQSQLKRLADKRVVSVQLPTHFTMADLLLRRYGAERTGQMMRLRSMIEAGITTAIASDTGAVSNPFLDILLAVVHPLNPGEAITLEQAVIAYTRSPAVLEFLEHQKGTLKSGKLADFAVLSQDIFSIPLEYLPETKSELTVVNGKIVYATGVITARQF